MANLTDYQTKTPAAISPQGELRRFLERNQAQLAMALPKHITPDRMMRLTLTAFSQNKALQNCDLKSIFACVILASQLGLEIGVNGHCYLVPFKGVCTFVPGWRGLVDLVNRSGKATVWTGAVFLGDEFECSLGDSPFIRHKPCGEDDPSKLMFVYAVGRVKGSDWPIIDVWPIAKVIRHRDRNNKVGAKHYSFNNLEMYARKLPLLQVIKYLPNSVEVQRAMEAEDAAAKGQVWDLDTNDFSVEPPESASDQQTEPQTEPNPEPDLQTMVAEQLAEPVQSEAKAAPSNNKTRGRFGAME